MHDNVQVAGRPAVLTGFSLAGNPQELPVINAPRDCHFNPPRFLEHAGTGAGPARLVDDPAAPAAVRALGDAHHLAGFHFLRTPDLAGSPACRAVPEVTGLSTGSMAGLALGIMRYCNGILRAVKCINERYFNIIAEICSGPLLCPPGSPGKRVEYIPETIVTEQVLIAGWPVSRCVTGAELDMPALVVLGFLLGVA